MLHEVAKTSDIAEGEVRRFVVNRVEIALANCGNETFLAVDDVCSHAEASLAEGEVDTDDCTIECPRHGSTFDLRTGKPTVLPATIPIPTFPVWIKGDTIYIELEG